MKVIIIGPAHPLRGGLASFNERLAREFQSQQNDVSIYTFSLQYPSFIFPGTTQYSSDPAPQGLRINICINSINPFNWIKWGFKIAKENADLIIIKYWIPFFAPAFFAIIAACLAVE